MLRNTHSFLLIQWSCLSKQHTFFVSFYSMYLYICTKIRIKGWKRGFSTSWLLVPSCNQGYTLDIEVTKELCTSLYELRAMTKIVFRHFDVFAYFVIYLIGKSLKPSDYGSLESSDLSGCQWAFFIERESRYLEYLRLTPMQFFACLAVGTPLQSLLQTFA